MKCGYTSTKGALEALTKTLKLELSKYNIVINIMHPPLTNTKSAKPLGSPVEMMTNPKDIGRKLAKKITSTKKIITPDFQTSFFTFLTYKCPYKIESQLSKMTEKALKDKGSYRSWACMIPLKSNLGLSRDLLHS